MPATAVDTTRPNTDEMLVVHRVFRRELPSASTLIARAPDGDRRRAAVVGEYVDLVLAGLHMHHVGEDEVLWPRLLERAAPSTGLVEQMQAQHELVDHHVARLTPTLVEWRRTAGAAARDRLARAVADLATVLVEHLDLEERDVLPLIDQHITAAEWDTLGAHGRDAMTLRQAPLMFGMLLEEADPRERAMLLDPMPAPLRWYLTTLGARRFRAYVTRLRNG